MTSNNTKHIFSDLPKVVDLPQPVVETFWLVRDLIGSSKTPSDSEKFIKNRIEGSGRIYAPIPEAELSVFNEVYFERNLLKCLIAFFRFTSGNIRLPFVDIGCGSGAASIAWILCNGIVPDLISKSVCFDRSERQLFEAKKNLSKITSNTALPSFQTRLESRERGAEQKVTLLSFLLCEAYGGSMPPRRVFDSCENEIYAIDYREVLTAFLNDFGQMLASSELFQRTYVVPKEMANVLDQDSIRVIGLHASKYC